jgi:hypothetical protein
LNQQGSPNYFKIVKTNCSASFQLLEISEFASANPEWTENLSPSYFFVKAGTLLICVEGVRSSKMHRHFSGVYSGCLFKVLRVCGSMGDHAGLMLEEAP